MSWAWTITSPNHARGVTGRARGAGENRPEPLQGLGRGGAAMLGQLPLVVLVEVETDAGNTGQPTQSPGARGRGQVGDNLLNGPTTAQRLPRPLAAIEAGEIVGQSSPFGMGHGPEPVAGNHIRHPEILLFRDRPVLQLRTHGPKHRAPTIAGPEYRRRPPRKLTGRRGRAGHIRRNGSVFTRSEHDRVGIVGLVASKSASPAIELTVGDRTVRVSNPDRVYFPEIGATKRDLVDYYLRSATAS